MNIEHKDLTQELLHELLDYHPNSGRFVWKLRGLKWFKDERSCNIWNSRYAGKVAGSKSCRNHTNYIQIGILGRNYLAHRLCWLYSYGELPDTIDHINGDGSDNRIENLRNVTQKENNRNTSIGVNNTSGYVGVCMDNRSGKWMAYIKVDGKFKNLGYFESKYDAHLARKEADDLYGFHELHGTIKGGK